MTPEERARLRAGVIARIAALEAEQEEGRPSVEGLA